ncbi:MAG: SHOCT domain-containing protein [Thermoleophilaceae bacterium]
MNERRHRVLVPVIFVLATLVGLVAMFSVWASRQALNTDNWTKTSGDMLANKNIRTAVGAYMVDQLFTNVDVAGQLRSALPPQAAALAGPAAAGLRNLADSRAPIFLERPRVQQAWRAANRTAHKELLTIINGGGATVSTKNGEVVLNLRNVIDQLAATAGVSSQVQAARAKLQGSAGAQARGAVQQKLGVTLPASTGQLVIMKSDQLKTVQDVGQGIRHLAVLLTAVTLLLFALAVWLARGWHRVALRTTGWCFVGLGVGVLFARRVVGDRVVDSLASSESVKPAAHSAWTIGTSLLYDIAIAMLAYGVILVIAAWLAGSSRSAVAVRRALAPELEHRLAMAYGAVAFLFLLVLLWGPTPATTKPLGIALFAGLIVLGMELLRRQTAREFPDARPGDAMHSIRSWLARPRGRAARPAADSAPAGQPRSVAERFDELDQLAKLHDRGVVTDDEFATQKAAILDAPAG